MNVKNSEPTLILDSYLSNRPALKRYLLRFIPNLADAEDLLQEAFVRALRTVREQKVQEPRAFLFKITRNLALNIIKRHSLAASFQVADMDVTAVIDSGPTLQQTLIGRQQFSALCEAVDGLPPRCQQVFIMRKVQGMSQKQIAMKLGISVSTVEKHVARGLFLCRQHLIKNGHMTGDSAGAEHSSSRHISKSSPR